MTSHLALVRPSPVSIIFKLSIAMGLSIAVLLLNKPLFAASMSDDGLMLLQKMGLAADQLDYVGEFVSVKNGRIDSMKVIHANTASGRRQKLMSLNGSSREIIQRDGEVACVLPDQGVGVREKQQYDRPFSLAVSNDIEEVKRYYDITHFGQARVANRDCENVKVEPKDQFRYGYVLCIDSENGLLLKSELKNAAGEVIENFMFVAIDFRPVNSNEFDSNIVPQSLDWMDDKQDAHGHSEMMAGMVNWKIGENATGFELEHYIQRKSPLTQSGVTHIVLGDGLAKVSVFVAMVEENDTAQKQAVKLAMGGLNSYSLFVEDYKVTAIGEVPEQTVAIIAGHTQLE